MQMIKQSQETRIKNHKKLAWLEGDIEKNIKI